MRKLDHVVLFWLDKPDPASLEDMLRVYLVRYVGRYIDVL